MFCLFINKKFASVFFSYYFTCNTYVFVEVIYEHNMVSLAIYLHANLEKQQEDWLLTELEPIMFVITVLFW